MKSDVFRFKRFEVRQRCSAMKVGMDGVSLGAWAFESLDEDAKFTVWDVGAGTGLLSLMIAQRFPCSEVYAVEIDTEAAKEAQGNFAASQFSQRLHCVNGNILNSRTHCPLRMQLCAIRLIFAIRLRRRTKCALRPVIRILLGRIQL